jgi:tRNA (cytidine/uridine-2'-O-)-methyltransferase
MDQSQAPLNAILFEPEIAWNTGAIGRTCVALEARLWLVRPLGFQISDRHRRRAGLDYWDHLDWSAVDSFDDVRSALDPSRLWYFSTRAERPYTQASFRPGDGLVFGPESRGLPGRWLEEAPERALRIPMKPQARSLNLAVSAAVALYEATRQIEQLRSTRD